MKPKFFAKASDFRKWLEKNHSKKTELLVGYYKKKSGKPSITWPESVDQALCYGWIDGIRRSLDEESYTIRFTPRKEKSHWSAVNLKKYKLLNEQGLVHAAGHKAFSKVEKKNTKQASFEQKKVTMNKELEAVLRANKKAWTFFQKLAPFYKKASIWWIISAKKDETKWKRLDQLIRSSEAHEKIPMLTTIKRK